MHEVKSYHFGGLTRNVGDSINIKICLDTHNDSSQCSVLTQQYERGVWWHFCRDWRTDAEVLSLRAHIACS